jgi:hypothetical protein
LAQVLFLCIIIIIILYIYLISTSPLAHHSNPQQLNMSAQKLYHHDQWKLYFQATLSFPKKFNFKILSISELDQCSTSQSPANMHKPDLAGWKLLVQIKPDIVRAVMNSPFWPSFGHLLSSFAPSSRDIQVTLQEKQQKHCITDSPLVLTTTRRRGLSQETTG